MSLEIDHVTARERLMEIKLMVDNSNDGKTTLSKEQRQSLSLEVLEIMSNILIRSKRIEELKDIVLHHLDMETGECSPSQG